MIDMLIGKCFRAFEIYIDGTSEGSIRDMLNRMEKRNVISRSVDAWISIRNLRNKIAHDDTHKKRKEMFDIIVDFFPELEIALQRLKNYMIDKVNK